MYGMKRLTCFTTGKFYTQSFDPWVSEKIYRVNSCLQPLSTALLKFSDIETSFYDRKLLPEVCEDCLN